VPGSHAGHCAARLRHCGGEHREHLCASWRESFTSDRTDNGRYARHGADNSAKGKRFYRTGASLKIEYAKEHRDENAAPQDFSPSTVVAAVWTGRNAEAPDAASRHGPDVRSKEPTQRTPCTQREIRALGRRAFRQLRAVDALCLPGITWTGARTQQVRWRSLRAAPGQSAVRDFEPDRNEISAVHSQAGMAASE
jgi:hypothetical protein